MPEIICPYCFGRMNDDEVLFRSERLSTPNEEAELIPEDYEDFDDFNARYRGTDKDQILSRYREWEFFLPKEDPVYENWWKKYGKTTEVSLTGSMNSFNAVPDYHRPIIDPKRDARYLVKQPDGGFLIYNSGVAAQIRLKSDQDPYGEPCTRRVCKHCHNPLPSGYGKHGVKFVSVIGITAAGKTVYLSQLLRQMKKYSQKVGLDATLTADGALVFVENNQVAAGKPLPDATPARSLQQPLFFDMSSSIYGTDKKRVETFVMYDVAGELFDPHRTNAIDMNKYAPFVRNSDGIILLIDPMQFQRIRDVANDGVARSDATTVLDQIHDIIVGENDEEKFRKPVAVCISKIDTKNAQMALPESLKQLLQGDVRSLFKEDKTRRVFDAEYYNRIADELNAFISEEDLDTTLETHYANYSYFAFTSLGCDVQRVQDENGNPQDVPVGPLLPKRIEEPLHWLFHELGYIGTNARIHKPCEAIYPCPDCGSEFTVTLEEPEEIVIGRKLFKKETQLVNCRCESCGRQWWNPELAARYQY